MKQAADYEKIALLKELEQSDASYIIKRQRRFEIQILQAILQVLKPHEKNVMANARAAVRGSDTGEFGFDWFNQYTEGVMPIKLFSFRLKKLVPFAKILRTLEQTKIFKAYQNYQDAWPETDIAMFIDMPNDGFDTKNPLVLRPDNSAYEPSDATWCIRLYPYGLAIGPFKEFLAILQQTYGYEL